MKSTRKIIIIIAAVIMALVLAIGVFMILNHNNKPPKTDNPTEPPAPVENKAKVILIGGQSNAAGCSLDSYLQKNVTPEKYQEYEAGYDNVYIRYFASGNNVSDGFVKCAAKQGDWHTYFGPELGMAEKLHELYPNERIFIIKWAWGGTNLANQWRAPSGCTGEGELYRYFVDYVHESLAMIKSMGYDLEIEAMCWMQGESDSVELVNALPYGQNTANLIYDIRAEFAEYASDDGIAFIDAYISDSPYWVNYEVINSEKQRIADSSPINVAINTIAEGLTYANEPETTPDMAHYDSMSEIKLGHLFAIEAAKFFDK